MKRLKQVWEWLFLPIVPGDTWVMKGNQHLTLKILHEDDDSPGWIHVLEKSDHGYFYRCMHRDIYKWKLYWEFRKKEK